MEEVGKKSTLVIASRCEIGEQLKGVCVCVCLCKLYSPFGLILKTWFQTGRANVIEWCILSHNTNTGVILLGWVTSRIPQTQSTASPVSWPGHSFRTWGKGCSFSDPPTFIRHLSMIINGFHFSKRDAQ